MKYSIKRMILIIALFVGFANIPASAYNLPAGTYHLWFSGTVSNPAWPCALVPANNCLLIVFSTQGVNDDGYVGPVVSTVEIIDPDWTYEATTSEGSKLYHN